MVIKRHEQIKQLLIDSDRVTVSQLSRLFCVSSVTIRKDLNILENQGYLIRTHGGAIPVNNSALSNSSFTPSQKSSHYNEMQKIGSLAADFVEHDDFIFLGPGFTCLEIAKKLKNKKRLTIITMNISAAIELTGTPEFKLITVPGDFTKRNGTYYVTGTSVSDYLVDTYFDKVFITTDGISLTRGFSVLDETIATIYQPLLEHSSEVFICATNNKFNKNAMAPLGPLTVAHHIITDKNPPEEFHDFFKQSNINLNYK